MPRFVSQGAKKRQKKIFYAKLILFFALFFSVLFFLSWLSRLEKLCIQNINIKGNSAVRTENILKAVDEQIAGDYFRLFPKRNILLYPKSKIEDKLLNSFLRIRTVDINFADFQSVDISLEERKSFAVWCHSYSDVERLNNLATSSPRTQLEEKCYLMDEKAFVFAKAPNFSGDVYFKYFGDLIGVATTTDGEILGQTFLKSERNFEGEQIQASPFEKINLFIRFLRDINIDGYKLSVKENGDYELFFKNESRLIFDANQDFDEILKNLRATLIDLGDLENKEFEYIDLRFKNKILYKFRE